MATISLPAAWQSGADTKSEALLNPARTRLLAGAGIAISVLAMLGLMPVGGVLDTQRGLPVESPAQRVVTVMPGEGLWSVAERAMPGVEARSAMKQLRAVNGQSALHLMPGQQLVVPPGY